jgi:4a-hydroxytetrahydrobiopterin dehydratase|tara:strand:+ start:27 stop:377 length:351 start_codon:yes stop_codon:yes gene_type:complete
MNNSSLTKLKCEPCSCKTPKLSLVEIQKKLSELNEWQLNDNKEMIFKKFKFKNFKKSIQFTNLVGDLAEEEGHHPDISLGWGYCLIMIYTHVIKGLSINDFILATKIDQLNKKYFL